MNSVRPPIGIFISLLGRQSKNGLCVFVPPVAASLHIAVPDQFSGRSSHEPKPLSETAHSQVFGRTRVRPEVVGLVHAWKDTGTQNAVHLLLPYRMWGVVLEPPGEVSGSAAPGLVLMTRWRGALLFSTPQLFDRAVVVLV